MVQPRRKTGLDSRGSLLLSAVAAKATTTVTTTSRTRGAAAGSAKRQKTKTKVREPVAVDALPLSSSSDEDDEDKDDKKDDDSFVALQPCRGNLSQTVFQQREKPSPAAAAGQKRTGPGGNGGVTPRVRPPAKKLLVAVERKRQQEAKEKRATEAEAGRVRGGTDGAAGASDSSSRSSNRSSSLGTKRARPKEAEAEIDTTASKVRKIPPPASSSAPLPSLRNSISGSGSQFDLGRKRPARSVGYSRGAPSLLARREKTGVAAAGSEATTRAGEPAQQSEPVVARFIQPPRLTPEPDSPPPKTFRYWKETINDKDLRENEDVSEKQTFKWPVGVQRGVDASADAEDTQEKATFKWPTDVRRRADADGDEDENSDTSQDRASMRAATTTRLLETKSTKATRVTKTTNNAARVIAAATATTTTTTKTKTTPTGATLESLKSRQTWRKNLQQKGRKGTGSKAATASLFGKLELEVATGGEDEVEASQQQVVFKMPMGYGSTAAGGTTAGAEDDEFNSQVPNDRSALDDLLVPDSDEEEDDNSTGRDETMPLELPPAMCPVCKMPVDDTAVRALLATLFPEAAAALCSMAALPGPEGAQKGRRRRAAKGNAAVDLVRRHLLRFDDKLKFCEGHRQRASRAAWVARGYPAIDWAGLGSRMRTHYAHVRRILEDETPSVFRTEMEQRGGGGGAADENGRSAASVAVTPGYYGQKGLRVLTEAIVHEFAGLLRRRAVADRLIAARGSSQFVEAVLVPELAVQLIREDMGVGAAEAQRILRESGTIGEDVHGEVGDVVTEEDEENDDDDDDGW